VSLEAVLYLIMISSASPGPNKLIMFASVVNFGFRRTVPLLLGIVLGVLSLFLCVRLGPGMLLVSLPQFHILKLVGAVFLFYIAFAISGYRLTQDGKMSGKPPNLFEGAAFQWVNPAVWVTAVMAMTVSTGPAGGSWPMQAAILNFGIYGFIGGLIWVGIGSLIRQRLYYPVRLKWFNIGMAALLVLSITQF